VEAIVDSAVVALLFVPVTASITSNTLNREKVTYAIIEQSKQNLVDTQIRSR
jgi:hypothetical protein